MVELHRLCLKLLERLHLTIDRIQDRPQSGELIGIGIGVLLKHKQQLSSLVQREPSALDLFSHLRTWCAVLFEIVDKLRPLKIQLPNGGTQRFDGRRRSSLSSA